MMGNQIDSGAVIRKVFRIYVDQASVLMPAAAVVFVITGVITQLILATKSVGLSLLVFVIDLIAGTLFTGMVVELVADVQDGKRDSSPMQLLRAVTPVLGQLVLVGVVSGVLEGIGFVALIVPGLFLITIWSVVAPVVVIERPGGLRPLARSRDLVRGNGMRVFGVILVLVIGVYLLSALLDGVAESAGGGAGLVVRVIVGVLAAPISALAAAVLYFELGGARRGGRAPGEPAPVWEHQAPTDPSSSSSSSSSSGAPSSSAGAPSSPSSSSSPSAGAPSSPSAGAPSSSSSSPSPSSPSSSPSSSSPSAGAVDPFGG
jgi:hypothetical protein